MTTDDQITEDLLDVAAGLRLRAARKRVGWSQERLGAAAGITFQQVQKYERGTNRVSISKLIVMARALGVPPADLLPEGGESTGVVDSILTTLARVRGAEDLLIAYAAIKPPRLRRAVLQLANTLAAVTRAEDFRGREIRVDLDLAGEGVRA